MKKTAILAIMAMMLFSACGNSDEKGKNANNQEQATELNSSESTSKDEIIKTLTYKKFIREVWDFERYTDSFAYKGDLPCVIDFYATWCGPCKKVAPIMEKLAKEYEGKVIVYKVDVDEEQKLGAILKIKNIPTVYFLQKGERPCYSVGAKDEAYFRAKFNNLLK